MGEIKAGGEIDGGQIGLVEHFGQQFLDLFGLIFLAIEHGLHEVGVGIRRAAGLFHQLQGVVGGAGFGQNGGDFAAFGGIAEVGRDAVEFLLDAFEIALGLQERGQFDGDGDGGAVEGGGEGEMFDGGTIEESASCEPGRGPKEHGVRAGRENP